MKKNLLNNPNPWIVFLFVSAALLMNLNVRAQLPDCLTGNTMYGVFNNIAGSTTADSMEIRPIAYSTGAVGPLIGGKRYWIRKQIGTTWYYGSAALGVSNLNNHFYVITQMSAAGGKDIIAIDGVTGATTVVGTMPASLNNYHFVKLAVAPNGFAYALGVARDTSLAANTFNPLVRFSVCGMSPTAGCASLSITILGYLPTTGNMYKWKLFNGDLAFDFSGNLYFATAGYEKIVGTQMGYTDARLFKIKVSDIPTTSGTGIIPMSLLSEYDVLDSTVINGIALDLAGKMYLSTRVFTGPQNNPSTTSIPKLFVSSVPGVATNLAGFSSPTPNFSIGDVASCNFPNFILSVSEVRLSGWADNGRTDLKWDLNNNEDVDYFELERSTDGNDFGKIATVSPTYTGQSSARYSYYDQQAPATGRAYYRVKAVMKSGVRNYSNVTNILFSDEMFLTSAPNPNPFVDHLDCVVTLKAKKSITTRILDQRGIMMRQQDIDCIAGENKININGLANLKAGMYIMELRANDQVMRSKLIKQ